MTEIDLDGVYMLLNMPNFVGRIKTKKKKVLLCRKEYFFYVPCHLRAWLVISLHNYLTFVALSKLCFFLSFLTPYFTSHSHTLLTDFLRISCLQLCPVSINFSKPSSIIKIIARYFNCHLLILSIILYPFFLK